MAIFIWLLKSAALLVVLIFVVMPVVHGVTRNRWIKLPVFVVLAVPSGAIMAWMGYVPYLLFFVWAGLTFHTLKAMQEPKFEAEAGMRANRPLFWVSSYAYVVLTCALGWFFQMEIVSGEKGIPLWKYLLHAG